MNESEKQRLYVGIVVTAFIVAISIAILWGQRSGVLRGEYILLTELSKESAVSVGALVFMNGEKVGSVEKVSPSEVEGKVAVRMWVKPDAFHPVGEDAVIWAEKNPEGATVLQLEPGAKGSSRKFIKIKVVRGVDHAPTGATKEKR